MSTEDQTTSGYRGPEEHWEQKTRGPVGTVDQTTSGYKFITAKTAFLFKCFDCSASV